MICQPCRAGLHYGCDDVGHERSSRSCFCQHRGKRSSAVRELRVGRSWSAKGGLTTVIEIGTGPEDDQGRRQDDRLIGVMNNPELAQLICDAVNNQRKEEDSK